MVSVTQSTVRLLLAVSAIPLPTIITVHHRADRDLCTGGAFANFPGAVDAFGDELLQVSYT